MGTIETGKLTCYRRKVGSCVFKPLSSQKPLTFDYSSCRQEAFGGCSTRPRYPCTTVFMLEERMDCDVPKLEVSVLTVTTTGLKRSVCPVATILTLFATRDLHTYASVRCLTGNRPHELPLKADVMSCQSQPHLTPFNYPDRVNLSSDGLGFKT